MGDDSLKILIEAALDYTKSLQNVTADLNKLREKLRNYQIKILAGLDKRTSKIQITRDLDQISKAKNRIKITGEIDRTATRENVSAALRKLKSTPIKVAATIDTAALKKQMPKISAQADVDVHGAEQVDDLRQKLDTTGGSAENMASRLYLARTALQLVRRAAHEAVDTIKELDSAASNLAVVTGSKTSDMYGLLSKYNDVAKELKATTTQVAGAAESWLRQGKSTAETASLIEQSMILSKTAMMNSEDATKRLTSALNGYKLEAQDASAVVDKLAALDSKAAVTAEDLAISMSQTASSANIGGVSMDRLLGYLTAVQEVTQRSAETIGQSFKTVFARIGNIKLGNFLSDDGEDLSDVETVLKNYGVALRNIEGDFRNFGDVLDEVYAKWENFSAVDKRAVAQAFAGTRQQENFLVLMENYGKALEYAGVAADSAGTSLKKFEAYQDSIEAKSAKFTAALEGLTLDTVDAGFIGDLIDAGTAVIELVEKTGLLKAALVSLGAGAVLKGVGAISSGFLATKQNILNLGEAVQTLRNVQDVGALSTETITHLGELTRGLTDEQLRLVLSTQQLSTAQMSQILVAGGLSEAEATAKLQTLGLATAQGTATAATFSLSGAMAGLGTAIKAAFASNPVGMIMLAVGAAYELVKGVMAIYDAVTVTAEEATEAMEESVSEFEDASNKVESLNNELQTTQDRIDELEAKDSLTFIEESELQKLRESVELMQIQADLAEKERKSKAKDAADDTVVAYQKNFGHDISADAVQEYMDYSNTSGNNAALFTDESDISALLAGIEQMKRLRDELDKSSKNYQEDYQHFQGIIDDATDSIWEQISVLGTYKSNLEAIPYDELTDNQKAVLDEINAAVELVYKALDPAKWNEIQWGNIVSDEKYSGDVKKLNELAGQSEITADTIKEQFPALAQACSDAGIAVEDVAENINASFDRVEGDGVAEYTAQLSNLSNVISGLKSSYDLLETAQKDMADGGGLSPETIAKLADAEANYLDYLYEENGVVKLNTEAWKENAQAKTQVEMANIQKEIDSLKAQNDVLANTLEVYRTNKQMSPGDTSMIEAWNKKIQEVSSEMEKNAASIDDYQKQLDILAAVLRNVASETDNLYGSLSSVKSAMSSLASAYNELNENGSVSYSALSSIASAFAEMVPNIDQYISRLAAAKGNSADTAEAINDLVNALISAKMSTEELANADENVIAAMLEEVGVVNSAEHAHWLITDAKAKNILATYDLTNATEASLTSLLNEIQGLLGEGDAAQWAEKYVAALRMEQILCNQNSLDSTDSVNSLIAIAAAAGASTTALSRLATAQKAIANGTAAGFHMLDQMDSIKADAEKEARDIVSSLKNSVSAAFTGTSTYKFKPKSSGSKSSKKEVEEYIAELDPLYEKLRAIQKLEDEITRENAKADLLEDNDFDGRIKHHQALVSMYQQEQTALHTLAEARRGLIAENVQKLTSLGFNVDYDASNNTILVQNMERINALQAKSKGGYESLQEATNAYRKETKDLIKATIEMVDANRDNSDSWWELQSSIKGARSDIVDTLIAMTDAANDAVDSIQNVSDVLSDAAQEFADNDGWISIDTFQAIRDLGIEYMQMLVNENNELVINRERINGIIEAKTRQLAVEQALSYVERLRLAATGASNESLDQLCFATTQATNSTWGLVYAELALMQQTGLLNGSQYQAALHNIQAIQSLAETAVAGIGQTAGAAAEKMDHLKEQLEDQKDALEDLLDDLEDMKDGCDDLVKYVMDMLKNRIQQQIDALNDAKKAVKDYVDQLKEAMRAEKENVEYEDELADKLKAIAKLQSKIDALSLDDSRKAQAEKMALEEELSELQKDLADFQADHAMDVTEDALDKQYEAYEQEKDAEIEKLEESISSTQKLYDMAIKYIKENWNTLYQELLDWNYEYGNSLNSEITAAWEAAQEAASRYGDFVTAIMGGIENEIAKITAQIQSLTTQISNLSTSTSGANGIGSIPNVVGKVDGDTSYSDDDMKQAKRKAASDIVSQMKALSSQWHVADGATQKQLEAQALQLGATLASYGVVAHRDESSGTWHIDNDLLNPSNAGKPLYSCYHTGGFVGDEPLKPNERYVKAENDELILTSDQQDSFAAQIDSIKAMTDTFSKSMATMPVTPQSLWAGGVAGSNAGAVHNVTTNNNQPEIHMGDIVINAPSGNGKIIADEVRKITRENVNEISRMLRRP